MKPKILTTLPGYSRALLAQDAGHESTRAAIRAYQGQYGVR